MSNISHINQKSKEIVEKIKENIFKHLFQILCDNNNLLDGKNIDIVNFGEIPQKIQDIILPIIEELTEQNETLTLEEFLMTTQHIYSTLPTDYKQFIMGWYLKNTKNKKLEGVQDIFDYSFKVIYNIILFF